MIKHFWKWNNESNKTKNILENEERNLYKIFNEISRIWLVYHISNVFKLPNITINIPIINKINNTNYKKHFKTNIKNISDIHNNDINIDKELFKVKIYNEIMYEGNDNFEMLNDGRWIYSKTINDYECNNRIIDVNIPNIIQQWHLTSGTITNIKISPKFNNTNNKIKYELYLFINNECYRNILYNNDTNQSIIQQKCIYYKDNKHFDCVINETTQILKLNEQIKVLCGYIICKFNDIPFHLNTEIQIQKRNDTNQSMI